MMEEKTDSVTDCHTFTKMRKGLMFNEPTEFNTLCYVANVDSSESVFQNGLTLNKTGNHGKLFSNLNIEVEGILNVSPIKSTEKKNGVQFSFQELKFLAVRRFYFVDFITKEGSTTLNILVTHKAVPALKKFNPFLETKAPSKSGTLPIVFFKGTWFRYSNMILGNGKKSKLKLQFLLDSIPQQNIVSCNFVGKESNNLIEIFRFFSHLSKYHGSNNIMYQGDKTCLYKLITSISQCYCDTMEVNTHPFMDEIGCINKAFFSIDFSKAFDAGQIQADDIKHINAMDLIFLKTQQVPLPQTMINVIMKGIIGMEKEEKSFQEIFSLFLQHFLTQEAKLTVQSNLIAYLCSL